jgi:antitoxin (DNA-binding transcriptional repressor) of toxin-antitoxin stability system
MPDMKTVTIRDLNRRTARILEAVEHGETFELRRRGKTVGYLSPAPPAPANRPDWKAHFAWLRKQPRDRGGFVKALDEERRRLRSREAASGNLR